MNTIDIDKLKNLQTILVRIDLKVAKYFNKQELLSHGLIMENTKVFKDAKLKMEQIRREISLTPKGKEIAYLKIN